TRNELDEATMVALRFCADTLSRERGEGEVDSDTLAELSTEVSSLLEKVLASEVPDELKVILSEGLEVVRRALLEYRLRGADGLRRALETVIGSLIRHSAEVKKNQGKKTVREYLEFLARLNDVVALSLKTKQLLAPVVNYFIGSGDN